MLLVFPTEEEKPKHEPLLKESIADLVDEPAEPERQ